MSSNRKYKSILPHLDRFQVMKHGRMGFLLEMIEQKGSVQIDEFLGYISHEYGIRRATGLEYIEAWEDVGCIIVEKNIIKFVKKPQEEDTPQ